MAPNASIPAGESTTTSNFLIKDSHENPSTSNYSSPNASKLIPLLSPTSHVVNPTFIADHDSSGYPVPIYLGQYQRPVYQDFVCGMAAAVFETTITYPLNKLIFRQQLHGFTLAQSVAQLRQEGIRFIYRGLLFPLMQKGASRSVMFGMYDEYRRLMGCRHMHRGEVDLTGRRHSFTSCHALAAFMAGATEACGLTPFERVQVLMQSSKYNVEFKNSFEALRRGLRPYGIREYYRGLSVILVRNGSTNVLFFALRNPLKELIARVDRSNIKELSANRHLLADFCCGAVLGACCSTCSYPLNVIKARMQSRLGGEFQGPIAVLNKILKERKNSIRHLYRGVMLNFTRSLLTWGLTNAGYEFFQRTAFNKGQQTFGSK